MPKSDVLCTIKRCKERHILQYMIDGVQYGICDTHWEWHNADKDSPDHLKKRASWRIHDHLDPEVIAAATAVEED